MSGHLHKKIEMIFRRKRNGQLYEQKLLLELKLLEHNKRFKLSHAGLP